MTDDLRTCQVCEDKPVAHGDVLCEPCRHWVDDDNTEIVSDPIELVLGSHQAIHFPDFARLCLCGEMFDAPGPYRTHVAGLIYEALGDET